MRVTITLRDAHGSLVESADLEGADAARMAAEFVQAQMVGDELGGSVSWESLGKEEA